MINLTSGRMYFVAATPASVAEPRPDSGPAAS